ncbi:MAG: hypothetical protein HY062_15000 [Bacteroidetes bacterium]|nr:hypothetical protein [Bacteroidota bacterium]
MNSELNNLEWFKTGFETYNPLPDTLLKINSSLKNYIIEIVIDVNCKDVQFLIPKLFKTLHLCEVPHCAIYEIDLKNLPTTINAKTIEKTPTIIFSKNEKEHFRITEKITYASSIEKEIEMLLSQQ